MTERALITGVTDQDDGLHHSALLLSKGYEVFGQGLDDPRPTLLQHESASVR